MRFQKLWIAILVVFGAVACAVVAAFLITYDLNGYREDIAAAVSARTGVPVVIDGDLKGTLGAGSPTLVAEGIHAADGRGALTARRLEIKLALAPLLRRRELVIDSLDVSDAILSNHRQTVNISRLTIVMGDPDDPLTLALSGEYGGVPVVIAGSLTPLSAVQAGGADAVLDLQGTFGILNWTLKGQPSRTMAIDLGHSQVSTTVSIDTSQALPQVRGAISATVLDLPQLKAALTATDGTTAPGDTPPAEATPPLSPVLPAATSSLFSNNALPWMVLKAFNGKIDLHADHMILFNGGIVNNVSASAIVDKNMLMVSPLNLDVGGGQMIATLQAQGQTHTVTVDGGAKGMTVAALLAQLFRSNLEGTVPLEASFHLTGTGDTPAALMANLGGQTLVTLGSGQLSADTMAWLPAPLRSEKPVDVQCGVINVHATNGVVRWNRQVAVETRKINAISSGMVDFAHETVDFTVYPQVKGDGFDVSGEILVEGPLARPHISFSKGVHIGDSRSAPASSVCLEAQATTIGSAVPTADAPSDEVNFRHPSHPPLSAYGKTDNLLNKLFGK